MRSWTRVATALLVALIACAPEEGRGFVYTEGFETLCEGTPCGWTRVDGTAEQAGWVETIHPGEHGLALRGEVRVRGPSERAIAPVTLDDDLTLELAARCDEDTTLIVDVLFADAEGVLRGGARAVALPRAEWAEATRVPLRVESGARNVVAQISSVMIMKSGAGDCEISDLTIDDGSAVRGCE